VEDTGSGMTDEVMQRMFEPFFTTKDLRHGTGLGLSVVHGIVLDHQAALATISSPGKGSRFEAYLPIWDKPIEALAIQPAPDAAQGERVLVVGLGRRRRSLQLRYGSCSVIGVSVLDDPGDGLLRRRLDGAPETWVIDEGALQEGLGEETPKVLGQRREIAHLVSQLEQVTKSEAAARESEQSFHFMVEHSRDVLFRGNYRTLQYDYLSPNIQRISGGFTVEEIVAMGQAKWVSRMRPEDVEQLGGILGELFSRGGGPYSTEFRIMGKDGVERWVNEVGTAFVDDEGVPSYAIASVRDITDQKQKEPEREKLWDADVYQRTHSRTECPECRRLSQPEKAMGGPKEAGGGRTD
jgi:PAS domain S-box-containing protein